MSSFAPAPFLTDFVTQLRVGEMGTGVQIAPLWLQDKYDGTYGKRSRQSVGKTQVERAPGATTSVSNTESYTEESFITKDRAVIKKVPVEHVSTYGMNTELQKAAAEAANEIRFAHEKAVHDTYFLSGSQADLEAIYGAGQVDTPTTKWDAANGNPAWDIREMAQRIYKRSGVKPNTVIMPELVYDSVIASIVNGVSERLKYTSSAIPDEAVLARMLGVRKIHVAKELYNEANPGQNSAFDYLYDVDSVIVAYVEDGPGTRDSLSIAKTIGWNGAGTAPFFGIETKWDGDARSWLVRCGAYFDIKTVDIACGGAFYNVLG